MTTPAEERARWDGLAAEATWDRDRVIACCEALEPIIPVSGWLLDLGCGDARLAKPILNRFPHLRVLGVDISRVWLDLAYERDEQGTYGTPSGLRLVQNNGRMVPRPELYFAGAYSVDLFAHLDPATVAGYLVEIGRTLRWGARVRFQYVDEDWPVGEWCATAGLHVETIDRDLVEIGWVWVTGVRPIEEDAR